MKAWERLLIIIPAGLALGAVGGHLASPVLLERGDNSALQALFESRAQKYGTSSPELQAEDATYYTGGYSYPPYLYDTADDKAITGVEGPDFAGWPEYKPAPMPTIDQLKAEVAARDASLGREAMTATDYGPQDGSADDLAAQGAGEAVSSANEEGPAPASAGQGEAGHPKVVILSQTPPPATTDTEPRMAVVTTTGDLRQ